MLFRVPGTQEADITCSTTNDITVFDDALHDYWPLLRTSTSTAFFRDLAKQEDEEVTFNRLYIFCRLNDRK